MSLLKPLMVPECPQTPFPRATPSPYSAFVPSRGWPCICALKVFRASKAPVHSARAKTWRSSALEITAPAAPASGGLKSVLSSNAFVAGSRPYPCSGPGTVMSVGYGVRQVERLDHRVRDEGADVRPGDLLR